MERIDTDGGFVVVARGYRLHVREGAWYVRLSDPSDDPWADFRLLAAADTLDGRDETSALTGPELDASSDLFRLVWRLGSSRWTAKQLELECREEELSVRLSIEGYGTLTRLTLLGGRGVTPDGASGEFWTGSWCRTLFSPAPSDPARIAWPAATSADISAAGGAEPGRGAWFFSPAPFCYALSRESAADPLTPPGGPWLSLALEAAPDDQRFIGFGYRGRDRGFRLVADYEGHTRVHGTWTSPGLVIRPVADPYDGLRAHRDRVDAGRPAVGPGWWLQPMFCGWGAQCAAAADRGLSMADAPAFASQAHYDAFLSSLEGRGIVPGTIVIDDKWQRRYARPEPDLAKWPDLRSWIASRHERGQRVLLWWKAWDPEGFPEEWCIRTADGRPVAMDPNHPGARAALAEAVTQLVDPSGLGADGLKIDFTARTPSGASLAGAPGTWGVDLLRLLLATIRDAAKAANPDSLLVGQVVEPSLADLVDMIRLNDQLRLDDPVQPASVVPQMTYRAHVVRASCPDHPIDTDDWCALDLADWRRYTRVKPELGVPVLYHATTLDRTGARLTEEDDELVRSTWRAYRARHGLAEPASARPG